MEDRKLLAGVESHHQNGLRPLHVPIAQVDSRSGADPFRISGDLSPAGESVIDVVRAERRPGELRHRVVVLIREPTASEESDSSASGPIGDSPEHLLEGRRDEPRKPEQRCGQALAVGEPERVTSLVAKPRVVDILVVPGQVADDFSAPDVHPHIAAAGAVRADRVLRLHIERTSGESIGRRGQRSHRADLYGVAGERRCDLSPRRDRHPLCGTPVEQLDEALAGDLVAEPSTAGAQDAALPIEENQGGERNRFLVHAFRIDVPALAGPERERLILEWTLTAPVAHRAVQWMVDEKELEDALLGLACFLAGVLGTNDHVLGDRSRAGRGELLLPLDLDHALAASAERIEHGMVAEPWNLDPEGLRGSNDQGSGGDGYLPAVDRQRDQLRAHRSTSRSAIAGWAPISRGSAAATGSPRNGQPPCSTWASYSSRKYLIDESIGETAPSPSAQKDLNRMLSPTSFMMSMSSSRPPPRSIRLRTFTIHQVPSRQGVHFPQDSWA